MIEEVRPDSLVPQTTVLYLYVPSSIITVAPEDLRIVLQLTNNKATWEELLNTSTYGYPST
jgi:hypothetical protein